MSESETQSEESIPQRQASPTGFQKRVLWRAITGVSIATIAALVVGAIIVVGKVFGFLQPVLVPLAVAGILAYLLDPVVRWAGHKKFFGRDLSRTQAVLLVFFLATAAMAFLAISVVFPASRQMAKLFDEKAEIVAGARDVLDGMQRKLADFEGTFGLPRSAKESDEVEEKDEGDGSGPEAEPEAAPPVPEPPQPPEPPEAPENESETEAVEEDAEAGPESQIYREFLTWLRSPETGQAAFSFLGKAANGVFGAAGYIIGFFLVPIYLFFFLKDAAGIRDGWAKYVPLRKSSFKDEVVDVLVEVNGYLIAFFRGQVLVSFIDGAVTGIILALLGLKYAFVIGVALAILGIIPFVGFIITAVPAIMIAAAQTGSWQFPLIVGIVFIAVQQIDGIFIQPKIVGDSVGLHPLTVIFSVLFWSLLMGGILGALLAVPMTAAVKVLFRRYIWEQKIRPNVFEETEPPPPAQSPIA